MADLWIFASRPSQLMDCLAAATILRSRLHRIHFVYQDHAPWQRAKWEEYRKCFDTVTPIPKVKACRAVKGIVKYTLDMKRLMQRLKNLAIAPDDLILTGTILTPLGQSVVSVYRQNFIVSYLSEKMVLDLQQEVDFSQYRYTTAGWLGLRIVEPLLGLRRAYVLKTRRPESADGERLRRFVEDVREIYSSTIIFHNAYASLPRASGDSLFHSPYPSFNTLREPSASEAPRPEPKLVVFFGTPFLLLKNIDPQHYIEVLNRALKYLRSFYPGCKLVYRPHPFESDEQGHLNLDGFEIQNDKEAGELFMLRYGARLEAVYTVSSTIARTAMNYGFNAYAFWPVFPFKEKTRLYFQSVMGAVPNELLIQSLERPPVAYASPDRLRDSFEQFRGALEAATSGYWREFRADG